MNYLRFVFKSWYGDPESHKHPSFCLNPPYYFIRLLDQILLLLGLPSAPKNTSVAFLNQSAATIRWEPPENTSKSNHVFYDIFCLEPCKGDGRSCIEEACPNGVSYIPSQRLNETQVTVTNLFTYANYTFKIYTKNRVSELAKRKDGVDGNFATVTLLTMGASKLQALFINLR